jgi:hypothetical protein
MSILRIKVAVVRFVGEHARRIARSVVDWTTSELGRVNLFECERPAAPRQTPGRPYKTMGSSA